jgi:hypothetical protein
MFLGINEMTSPRCNGKASLDIPKPNQGRWLGMPRKVQDLILGNTKSDWEFLLSLLAMDLKTLNKMNGKKNLGNYYVSTIALIASQCD